ncbi:MAG: nuclear transport factor 2 family protein [Ktedonobacterales bacterium]|jgi:ketosteroid isomerase-like protein
MSEAENRQTLEKMVAGLNAKNPEVMGEVFADDALVDWPQSGERIHGRRNVLELYRHFPALPTINVTRLISSGDLCVVQANLDYGDGTDYRCIFIFEMRDGRIAHETGYWSQPFPAPDWRAAWVERR